MRAVKWTRALVAMACTVLAMLGGSAPAHGAGGDPLFIYDPSKIKNPPPPFPPFEGPCGLTVDLAGNLYVSDYYHHMIDIFRTQPTQLLFSAQLRKVDPIDGPCGLAVDTSGNLYVNDYHRNVEKFVPSALPITESTAFTPAAVIDTEHPTGVAVDPGTGTVYVNDRTYVAAYDATGSPILAGGEPLHIGEGSIEDGYGLAVSAFPPTAGYLYVPDAASGTVKVFDPATDPDEPVATIDAPAGGFRSLHDAAIAVDWTIGDVYVADTLGPQFTEKPLATIQVFDSTGAYEGQLKHQVIDGAPVGLAVNNSVSAANGSVYVTSGNSENSVIYAYGPGSAVDPPVAPLSLPEGDSSAVGSAAGSRAAGGSSQASAPAGGATSSAIAQKGTLRVSVSGSLAPRALPRKGSAPVSVSVGGEVSTTDESSPPQLKALQVELNKEGRIEIEGLPTCPYDHIQPASTQRALSACRSALVGEGSFTADIALTGQEPYPTKGKLLLFNAKEKGKPVLYGQIYSPRPFATSFVIAFRVKKQHKGPYGTVLSAFLPEALGSWGNLTGIEMTLSRHYSYKGRSRSYISAGCPAPKGFGAASFPLARASFEFEGGKELRSVLGGTCRVRG